MEVQALPFALNRLSQIKKLKDIKPLSSVTYPGTHCPLFGSAMTIRLIEDALMLVIGTEECTYYTKSTSLVYDEFGGINGRCVSFVMNHHDVTFGCRKKMEQAVDVLVEEYHPQVIFMVTTCVPEMTGEDIDAIADMLSKKHGITMPVIHTDHFRCDGHMLGVQNTMKACVSLMEAPSQNTQGINLLGKQAGNSELAQYLKEADIKINLAFPSHTSLEELKQAANAKMNIVCSRQALVLAQEMEKKFGIPYVSFYDRCTPSDIEEGYQLLFQQLNKEIPNSIQEKRIALEQYIQECSPILKNGTYIYGNSSVDTFVLNAFLVSLGMNPLMIQTKDFEDHDIIHVSKILQQCDPLMTRSANLASLRDVYGILKPDLYLGPAERDVLLGHGIIGIGLPHGNDYIGFELSRHILDIFSTGLKKKRQLSDLEKGVLS